MVVAVVMVVVGGRGGGWGGPARVRHEFCGLLWCAHESSWWEDDRGAVRWAVVLRERNGL